VGRGPWVENRCARELEAGSIHQKYGYYLYSILINISTLKYLFYNVFKD